SRDRRIAGLDPNVDYRYVARLHGRDRLLEGRQQIARLYALGKSNRTLAARQPGAIDVGIGNALADPAVLRRPVADARHALLVQLIIEKRTIFADDHEGGKGLMKG